jgi:hypothetical protein
MLTVSLVSLIQQATLGSEIKHASGQILDATQLFDQNSLTALENSHDGAFGFLAFDPAADHVVVQYLRSNTLATDSGSRLLVLYVTTSSPSRPTPEEQVFSDWIEIDRTELPAQRLVALMFKDRAVPSLPGLVLFDKWVTPSEAVYFSLDGHDNVNDLRTTLRRVFRIAEQAVRLAGDPSRSFSDELAIMAQKEKIRFERSGHISLRQWLIQSYQFLSKHSGEIIAAIGLIPLGA